MLWTFSHNKPGWGLLPNGGTMRWSRQAPRGPLPNLGYQGVALKATHMRLQLLDLLAVHRGKLIVDFPGLLLQTLPWIIQVMIDGLSPSRHRGGPLQRRCILLTAPPPLVPPALSSP